MLNRWIMKDLEAAMAVRRGVNLTGARQVGKSTLAEMLNLVNAKRYTFDDRIIRLAAAGDPNVRHSICSIAFLLGRKAIMTLC